MAEQHVRAVQIHSKIDDRLTRNILEVIALDIGRNGKPAYTSLRTIADRARCAVNTARDRIEDILKSKELVRTLEGRYSVYSLNPELIPYDSVAEETHEDGGVTAQFARLDDIEAMEKRLYQNVQDCINPLYQLYQTIVSTVSTDQSSDDTEVKKKDKKGRKDIYTEQLPDPVNEMVNALSRASGVTCAVGVNDSEFRESAYALIGNDLTPEDLPLFCAWWGVNGHYKGKPAIKSILTKIKSAKDSGWRNLPKTNGTNGHHDTATARPEVYDPTMPKPGQGGVW